MIIGNGDIATALREGNVDRDDVIFFASGVSNSRCIDTSEFTREIKLFSEVPDIEEKHLVYFSTLSVYYGDKETPYINHKDNMEKNIKFLLPIFTIVRIGNITWGNNPHTLINYFKDCIKNNKTYKVNKEYRFLIHKQEFLWWMKHIRVGKREEMNITGDMVYVPDLVQELENQHKAGLW